MRWYSGTYTCLKKTLRVRVCAVMIVMDGQSEEQQYVCEVLSFHPLLNSTAKHMQGMPGSANSFAAGVLGAPTGQGRWDCSQQCYLRSHCYFSRHAINHSLHALHQKTKDSGNNSQQRAYGPLVATCPKQHL